MITKTNTLTTSEGKIAEFVRAGQLSADDARALKSAMPGASSPRTWWRGLFDPWVTRSQRMQLSIALAVVVASAALTWATNGKVRFNGALDLHLLPARPGLRTALLDQAAGWLLTALAFWVVARALRARPRVIDLLMTVGAARLPLLLAGALLGLMSGYVEKLPASSSWMVVPALVGLPLVGFFLVLLFTGWRYATGLRAPRVGIGFALGILVAEVMSQIVLSL